MLSAMFMGFLETRAQVGPAPFVQWSAYLGFNATAVLDSLLDEDTSTIFIAYVLGSATGTGPGYLAALDAGLKAVRWTYTEATLTFVSIPAHAAMFLSSSRDLLMAAVLPASKIERLQAFSVSSGVVAWNAAIEVKHTYAIFAPGTPVLPALASGRIGGGVAAISPIAGTLVLLDEATGTATWTSEALPVDSGSQRLAAFDPSHTRIVVAQGNSTMSRVLVFDAATGALLWSVALDGSVLGSISVGADSIVTASAPSVSLSSPATLQSFALLNGAQTWSVMAAAPIFPAGVATGTSFVRHVPAGILASLDAGTAGSGLTGGATLYLHDVTTGVELWRWQPPVSALPNATQTSAPAAVTFATSFPYAPRSQAPLLSADGATAYVGSTCQNATDSSQPLVCAAPGIYAVTLASSTEAWAMNLETVDTLLPEALGSGGSETVVALASSNATSDASYELLSLANGSVTWAFGVASPFAQLIALGSNGTAAYVLDTDPATSLSRVLVLGAPESATSSQAPSPSPSPPSAASAASTAPLSVPGIVGAALGGTAAVIAAAAAFVWGLLLLRRRDAATGKSVSSGDASVYSPVGGKAETAPLIP